MKPAQALANTKEIRLKPVRDRTSAIRSYNKILNDMVAQIGKEARSSVVPVYRLEYAADSVEWFDNLRTATRRVIATAIRKTSELFERESNSHATRLAKSFTDKTKVPMQASGFLDSAAERKLAQQYIESNASLISSVGNDARKKIEQAVYRARIDQKSPIALTKEIRKITNSTKGRAKRIAVDQIASLNADLTTARHNELGIEEYIWRTRGDSVVRERHANINGTKYKVGEPTGAEGGQEPGKPIHCRCIKIPVIPAKTGTSSNTAEIGQSANAVGQSFGIAARVSSGFLAGLIAGVAAASEEDETQ